MTHAVAAGVLVVATTVPCLGGDAIAPQEVRVLARVPLHPDLLLRRIRPHDDIVVTHVSPGQIRFRQEHGYAETVVDREATAPRSYWLPLSVGQQLAQADVGETIGLAAPDREPDGPWRFAGTSLLPCRCNGHAALVPCWVLQAGRHSMCVMAEPTNPLIVEHICPVPGPQTAAGLYRHWSMSRTVEIDGPGIELLPLDEWRAK